jgi:3-oxoadipate enol-lactonase
MTETVALHHVQDGPADAPAVLLLGSLGSDVSMWDDVVPSLATRLRVVRADLRGHGASPVPPGPYEVADLAADVVRLLDDLGLAQVHLVGLSLGGMTAMQVAADHPERVDRLALLCTSALLGPPEGWRQRADSVTAGGTGAVADAVAARWLTPSFAAEQPQVLARVRAMIAATPSVGYAAGCGAIERMDLRERIGAITAPTLAIAGADDPATPPEHLERIVAAVPGARLRVLDHVAHVPTYERPAEIARLLLAHLAGE